MKFSPNLMALMVITVFVLASCSGTQEESLVSVDTPTVSVDTPTVPVEEANQANQDLENATKPTSKEHMAALMKAKEAIASWEGETLAPGVKENALKAAQDGNIQEAIRLYKSHITLLDEGDIGEKALAYFAMGTLYLANNDTQNALSEFNNTSTTLSLEGITTLDQIDQFYKDMYVLFPEDIDIAVKHMDTLTEAGNHEEALAIANSIKSQLGEESGENLMLVQKLAFLHQQLRNTQELSALNQVLEQNGIPVYEDLALLEDETQGEGYRDSKEYSDDVFLGENTNYQAAVAQIEASMQADPENNDLMRDLMRLHIANSNLSEAEAVLVELVEKNPASFDNALELAYFYHSQNMTEKEKTSLASLDGSYASMQEALAAHIEKSSEDRLDYVLLYLELAEETGASMVESFEAMKSQISLSQEDMQNFQDRLYPVNPDNTVEKFPGKCTLEANSSSWVVGKTVSEAWESWPEEGKSSKAGLAMQAYMNGNASQVQRDMLQDCGFNMN